MKHGRESYFLKNFGWVSGSLIPLPDITNVFKKFADKFPVPVPDPIDPSPGDPPTKPRRIFCRLFGEGAQPSTEALIELGLAMESEMQDIISEGDSNIPAGYTYLGQFIDHDITRDDSSDLMDDSVDPTDIMNVRTPALDLDCLYGSGPKLSAELFESDGVHLRVGMTSPTVDGEPGGEIPGIDQSLPNDLPRREDMSAIIGDSRNDENLAVAQTHLAFIKFHNAVVDRLVAEGSTLQGEALYEKARRQVVFLYQSIVLKDFLPRLIEVDVLKDVLTYGRKFYTDDLAECMPIEFSVAAYRLGHSMIRTVYEWNRVFNSDQERQATLDLLFEFSGGSGVRSANPEDTPFFDKPTVPTNWIVDWTRLYDFSGIPDIDSDPTLNFARQIDARLSFALKTLPEFQRMNLPDFMISLATRNLLRGRLMKLPSGQAVAQAMQNAGLKFTPITAAEIANGPHSDILLKHGLDQQTPLWYYILREAKIRNNGNKLGPVGSRIIAEVFVGLIANSPISVLKENQDLRFSMPELLAAVDDLNPLGNLG
ncbi:peroxidase [Acaryochloris sp. CCMEE 5410]|nr:peroxidase [Acaryochloris sp. CCMEE 5410]